MLVLSHRFGGLVGSRGIGVLALGVAATMGLSACSPVHDAAPVGTVIRSNQTNVAAEITYAKAHYKNPNTSKFGDLHGTDCVNFVSQTLLARGWKMNGDWGVNSDLLGMHYTRPWISSTGFHDYLAGHPELASALTWQQRDKVSVGDVVQFDWDASGDRDHTAIVSGILGTGPDRVLLLSSHSPAAFDWPITDALAEHGAATQVYFWHLN